MFKRWNEHHQKLNGKQEPKRLSRKWGRWNWNKLERTGELLFISFRHFRATKAQGVFPLQMPLKPEGIKHEHHWPCKRFGWAPATMLTAHLIIKRFISFIKVLISFISHPYKAFLTTNFWKEGMKNLLEWRNVYVHHDP